MKFIYLFAVMAVMAAGAFGQVTDAPTQSDFPYDKYTSRTLAEIIGLSSNFPKSDSNGKPIPMPDLFFSADFLHSRVRVRFMNKSRTMPTDTKDLLESWRKSYGLDTKLIGRFETEYLFKECNSEYWIPVQSPVAAYFPKELKEGEMVTLYLIRSVGKKAADGKSFDFIFLVNEFDK
jgi:hypothetical protein